eukprot:218439-Pyramimonas_sp.AAC.1
MSASGVSCNVKPFSTTTNTDATPGNGNDLAPKRTQFARAARIHGPLPSPTSRSGHVVFRASLQSASSKTVTAPLHDGFPFMWSRTASTFVITAWVLSMSFSSFLRSQPLVQTATPSGFVSA